MSDVFISYGHSDADWVRGLAGQLEAAGIRVFFDEWDLDIADVATHRIDRAITHAKSAIVVLSPESLARPWVQEEYAALLERAVSHELTLIPVIYRAVQTPPLLGNRVPVDFSRATPEAARAKLAALIRVLRGEPPPRRPEQLPSWSDVFPPPTAPAPPASPAPPGATASTADVVICFEQADSRYAAALTTQLFRAGLPAWSRLDLRPGDQEVRALRERLRGAAAVVVLMSDDSQASEPVTAMILEASRLGRVFVPILISGARNYHLAASWYFDARSGRLPGPDLLAMLHRLVDAERAGRPLRAEEALPPPLSVPPAPLVTIPAADGLRRLRHYLSRGELEYADLLTTTVLLAEAGRLAAGWISPGTAVPDATLTGVDELWTRYSNGRFGLSVQRGLSRVARARHADFLSLSVALGWRAAPTDPVPRYEEFVRGALGQSGFFPTLRNPQTEQFTDWYLEWWQTVVTIHLRLNRERRP